MRLKLLFSIEDGYYLNFNYPYYIASWLYKQIAYADAPLAEFLHRQGYQSGRKNFKLHTFSSLQTNFTVENGLMRIKSREASLHLNFYLDTVAERFVQGLFMHQHCILGDNQYRLRMTVRQVEVLPMPPLHTTTHLQMRSPIVVSRRNERGLHDYLSPEHEEYADLLLKNLIEKYESCGASLDPSWQNHPFEFRLLRYHKKPYRLISIKSGTPEETKVRGYLFDFALTAPTPLIEVGLLAG
ncbi:CRISPR-associated endoribonuclease Cas6, partial [Rhodoflexus sp.]